MPRAASERGSLTLEAAIALPVFICVVIAFAFLLRVVQVHERMQHALCQAALEIAGVSYIYDVSGLLDVQRELEGLEGRAAERVKEAAVRTSQFASWLPAAADMNLVNYFDRAGAALANGANSLLFMHFAKFVTEKYLEGRGVPQGLDFMWSAYLHEGDDVKLNVNYTFDMPVPIKPPYPLGVEQTAHARAWLSGAGSRAIREDQRDEEDDIWSLGNFVRGVRIQEIFHANLPIGFPGLSSYEDGTATLIRSLDTTAASYQTASGIGKTIDEYVRAIRDYGGQDKPWGNDQIVIPAEDIAVRRLVLVIPKNDVSPAVGREIDRCIRDALAQGVILQVERYATKRVETEK